MAVDLIQPNRFYLAPPIVEAVIEVRFRDKLNVAELKKLSRRLAKEYPHEAEQVLRGAQVNFEMQNVVFVDEAQQVRRSSSDEVEIVVLKPEAFSFSRLAPYSGWDTFSAVVARDLSTLLAFRRLKNFACVELRNQLSKLLIFVRVSPETVVLEPGFTRDVRGIGHFGTGDLEVTIQSMADLEKAKPLFDAAYHNA